MSKTKQATDVRDVILERMESKGQNLTWLSEITEIPYGTIISCLKRKLFSLNQDNLDKINKALETDYSL